LQLVDETIEDTRTQNSFELTPTTTETIPNTTTTTTPNTTTPNTTAPSTTRISSSTLARAKSKKTLVWKKGNIEDF